MILSKGKHGSLVMTWILIPLIFLWIYAGTIKLIEHEIFLTQVRESSLLYRWGVEISWLLPLGEIGIACLLCSARLRKMGLLLSAVLLMSFTIYLFSQEMNSDHRSCACGGLIDHMSWRNHILFNLCFITISIFGLTYHQGNISLDRNRGNRKPVVTE